MPKKFKGSIREKMERLFLKDDSHEFQPALAEIEDQPTSPMGRLIFWVILAALLFGGLWLFFGQVDVVITARGQIIPQGHSKLIQPLDTGVVRSILVKEGDAVKAGQTLMEIDPSSIEPEFVSLKEELAYTNLEIERLDATLGNKAFQPTTTEFTDAIATQREVHNASLQGLNSRLQSKGQELAGVKEQMQSLSVQMDQNKAMLNMSNDKAQRLDAVKDIVARQQIEQVQEDQVTYQNKVLELQHASQEALHQQSQLVGEITTIKEDFRNRHLTDLAEKQKRAIELQARMLQSGYRSEKQTITSPVDGTINELFVHTIGGVVTPAQELMSVVPEGAPPVIKATVMNKDIGFVSEGMEVNIKVDTYEFQKYGMLSGKVIQVAKDARTDEQLGPVYDVFVEPIDKHLMVDGEEVTITPGMSVSAEIKTGKRRIIEFFIYPMVKYWNEGISVR